MNVINHLKYEETLGTIDENVLNPPDSKKYVKVHSESSHLLAVSSRLRSNFEDIFQESRRDKKHLGLISTWIEVIKSNSMKEWYC